MVAIKDMEMPKDCMECMFCNHIKSNDYGTYGDCAILGDKERMNLLLHQKHSYCPLIEIEERKVGHWFPARFGDMCSNCHKQIDGINEYLHYDYCPNCGADMRGNEK